jgi:NAD(P) transhydrogenase subunit alpha
MSATNAISGISLVGSLVAAGSNQGAVSTLLGTIAVTAATINVVGGFMITDRMLKMFHRRTIRGKEAQVGHEHLLARSLLPGCCHPVHSGAEGLELA